MNSIPDLCEPDEQWGILTGTTHWPRTLVGYRTYLRCPYAVYNATYAWRNCVLEENGNASWVDPDMSPCPLPPISQILDHLSRTRDTADVVMVWVLLFSDDDDDDDDDVVAAAAAAAAAAADDDDDDDDDDAGVGEKEEVEEEEAEE